MVVVVVVGVVIIVFEEWICMIF